MFVKKNFLFSLVTIPWDIKLQTQGKNNGKEVTASGLYKL